MRIVHFKCNDNANEHNGWCPSCDAREFGVGRAGAARVRRWARKHVANKGHEVRIDVSRQHGYRLSK